VGHRRGESHHQLLPGSAMADSLGCLERKSRVGARSVMSIMCGLLPAYFVLFVLPIYPLYKGHIEVPRILLSSIMAAHPTYQSLYIMGFGMPLFVVTFLLTQVCQHFKVCGVPGNALNTFLFLVVVPSGIGLLMLLGFCFEDESLETQTSIHTFLHNGGTMVYFAGAGAACWVYTNFVQPAAQKVNATHPVDLIWSSMLGKQLTIGTCLAGVVRGFHITWPLSWAIPMLMVECYVTGLAISVCVLGNFRLFMHLDAIDPLIDLSFIFAKEDSGPTQLTEKILSADAPVFKPPSDDKIVREKFPSDASTEATLMSDETDRAFEASESCESETE